MTSYELQVRETDLRGIALVELAGELDLTNAAELERRLDELGDDSKAVVLDLDRLEFLDSAALHVFFRLARRLSAEDKRFGIVLAQTAPVSKTVAIVRLDQAAVVHASLHDVLAELQA